MHIASGEPNFRIILLSHVHFISFQFLLAYDLSGLAMWLILFGLVFLETLCEHMYGVQY